MKAVSKPVVHLTFEKELEIYLKDSNAYGNIYFARYFEWQGITREAWFSNCVLPNMFTMEGAFVTKSAHNDFMREVRPFSKILAKLNTSNIKRGSFELVFSFIDMSTGDYVSRGTQKVAYLVNNKLTPLPTDVLGKVKQYELH